MGRYYIHKGGVLLATGSCADGDEKFHEVPGAVLVVGEPPAEISYAPTPPKSYTTLRLQEYPPLGEFADAWVKQDEAALEAYRQKCLAVKVKYPKE